jgi:hypothetical protein
VPVSNDLIETLHQHISDSYIYLHPLVQILGASFIPLWDQFRGKRWHKLSADAFAGMRLPPQAFGELVSRLV